MPDKSLAGKKIAVLVEACHFVAVHGSGSGTLRQFAALQRRVRS